MAAARGLETTTTTTTKVIHWKLNKAVKFGHVDKCYMYKPESLQENETHKIFLRFWDTNGRKTKLNLNYQDKTTCYLADFAVAADHREQRERSERLEKFLDLAKESKKLWNMKVMVILIVAGTLGMLKKRLEELEIRGRIKTIQITALIRLARNTLMCPGDPRRLAVTQTPVKDHQLKLL